MRSAPSSTECSAPGKVSRGQQNETAEGNQRLTTQLELVALLTKMNLDLQAAAEAAAPEPNMFEPIEPTGISFEPKSKHAKHKSGSGPNQSISQS